MNGLERAATALVDRPSSPPAALESIERRAGSLRRRRRLVEVGVLALVVLVLGTAGLALNAARTDDDQGVFVGEGPGPLSASTVATYHLTSPIDGSTAEVLKQTIEARFRWAWTGDAVVEVDGTEVTVSAATPIPADRFDALVTSPGGFVPRIVGADAPEATCRAAAPPYGEAEALWTSAVAGPPRCLSVEPPIVLPSPPALESGISESPDGRYQTDLVLTAAASQVYLEATSICTAGSDAACGRSTIGVVTDGAILHPAAPVTVAARNRDGANIVSAVPGFTDHADAELWAAVLVHALPDGVQLTRLADDSAATSTSSVTTTDSGPTSTTVRDGMTSASGSVVVEHSFPPPAAAGTTVLAFTGPPLDDASWPQIVDVFDARIRTLGLDTGGRAWVDASAQVTRIGFQVPTPQALPTVELAEDLAIQAEFVAAFASVPDHATSGQSMLHAGGPDEVLGATVDGGDPTVVHVRIASTLVPVAEQLLSCLAPAQCLFPEVSFPISGRTAEATLVGSSGDRLHLQFPDAERARVFDAVLQHPLPTGVYFVGIAS